MKLNLTTSEWYPVWEPTGDGTEMDLPDDVVARYLTALAEFTEAHRAMATAVKDADHRAAIERRRAERGQRRPRRRPHPTKAA